jgi:hypothetical protein
MEDELIFKTIKWMEAFNQSVEAAGGRSDIILKDIPEKLLITLVRNNLVLTYARNRV